MDDPANGKAFLSTGIEGLDDVLRGGLTARRLYLIEGVPGTGKTTVALQFLMQGAKAGETVLYVTLSETEEELRAVAASHGWQLDGVTIHEVIASEELLDPAQQHTLFHPSEIELGDTTQDILKVIETIHPSRVVIDSLSELRLLAANPLRYRRQILAYKQYFSRKGITTLVLDDRPDSYEMQVRSIAHGVINLDYGDAEYGNVRRKINVIKYRGVDYQGGFHDYKIARGGIIVYPRLVAHETRADSERRLVSSNVEALDRLLGGGLEQGTSTLIGGPPGTGKSTLAAQFVAAAISRGEGAAMFVFEESVSLFLRRTTSVGIDLRQALSNGQLSVQQVDPAEMSPGEFAHAVRAAVEVRKVSTVVIDSLNGYLNAMPDERFLTLHMHELLTYLGQRGVVAIFVSVQKGVVGDTASAVEASYLADNMLNLRHFEFKGEVRQAVSVFKKRGSSHERTIREFAITASGIRIGEALREFHGLLTGIPTFTGNELNEH